MLRVAVKGQVATKHSERRGRYTDGLLHSADDIPALVTFANYFVRMVYINQYTPAPEDEWPFEVKLYWFAHGQLHRGQGRPAVLFPCCCRNSITSCRNSITSCRNSITNCGKRHALWFVNGIAHTPRTVVSRLLYNESKLTPLGGETHVAWKGTLVYPNTICCKQVQAGWVHIKECVERMHDMCRCWSEFSARDTVRYGKYGLIHCSDDFAVERIDVKGWLYDFVVKRIDVAVERIDVIEWWCRGNRSPLVGYRPR
jgi:hypothetical protein